MFTVIDRIRALGFEASKAQRWAIGNAVRNRYQEITGHLPEKHLREKTAGGGSHCFATYPAAFVPVIDEIIRAHRIADDAQLRLF